MPCAGGSLQVLTWVYSPHWVRDGVCHTLHQTNLPWPHIVSVLTIQKHSTAIPSRSSRADGAPWDLLQSGGTIQGRLHNCGLHIQVYDEVHCQVHWEDWQWRLWGRIGAGRYGSHYRWSHKKHHEAELWSNLGWGNGWLWEEGNIHLVHHQGTWGGYGKYFEIPGNVPLWEVKVPDNKNTHILCLAGVFQGDGDILMHSQLLLLDTVTM